MSAPDGGSDKDAVPDQWQPRRVAATLLYVGTINALSVLVAMAIGWGIDHILGTTPLFILLGLPLGILAGIAGTVRVVRDYLGQ